MKHHPRQRFTTGLKNSPTVVRISVTLFKGRPSTVTHEYIDAMRKLIISDCDVMQDEIETFLNISRASIQSILYDYLKVKNICSQWISHNLSQAEKDVQMEWC